jgi:hypothetical protein
VLAIWVIRSKAAAMIQALLLWALINSHELHAQALQPRSAGERQNTWQSLCEGVAYVWNTPAVLLVILVVGLVLLFGSNFNVVLPLFATDVLHVGATGFGFLSAATGVGALLSALWLAWGNQQPSHLEGCHSLTLATTPSLRSPVGLFRQHVHTLNGTIR